LKTVLAAAVTAADANTGQPAAAADDAPIRGFLKPVRAYMEERIGCGIDVYGPEKTPMWIASLDTKIGHYPDAPYTKIGQRVYRGIAAPNGSSIYWHQPELVAAYAMSGLTGDPLFKQAVDDYVKSFLERGIDENGLFEWGNHRYYDALTDRIVRLGGGPHEIRPLTPAWEIFWAVAPKATEWEIRQSGVLHLFDPASGGFDRHELGENRAPATGLPARSTTLTRRVLAFPSRMTGAATSPGSGTETSRSSGANPSACAVRTTALPA
jgi:hypothetical protein